MATAGRSELGGADVSLRVVQAEADVAGKRWMVHIAVCVVLCCSSLQQSGMFLC